MQLTNWESAVTVRGIYLLYRLLIVLFESSDLCYLVTRRSMLEICEIGEQGVSFVGFKLLVSFVAESLLKLQLIQNDQ